jgi:hypothetical protein
MRFNLRRPCENCPFRSDIAGYLDPRRAIEIANALERKTFACHKTTGADGRRRRARVDQEHCAGAILSQLKSGVQGDMVQLAERMGLLDLDKLDRAAPVHSLQQFADANGADPSKVQWRCMKEDA